MGPAKEAPIQTFLSPAQYATPTTAAEARMMVLLLGGLVARSEISVLAHDVLIGNLRLFLTDRAAEQEKRLTELENHIRYGGEPPWAASTGDLNS